MDELSYKLYAEWRTERGFVTRNIAMQSDKAIQFNFDNSSILITICMYVRDQDLWMT